MKKATFMEKLKSILEDASVVELVRWIEYGVSFEVTNPTLFASQVLPRYFKHANFSSFIRQLHGYGYHKRGHPDGHVEFFHSELADPSDMNTVQRKYNTTSRSTIDVLRTQVDELKEVNRMLQEENERLQRQMDVSSTLYQPVKQETPSQPTFSFQTSSDDCAGASAQEPIDISVDDFFYNGAETGGFTISPMDAEYYSNLQQDVKPEHATYFHSPELPSLHRIPSLNEMSMAGDMMDQKQDYGYTGFVQDFVKFSGYF